MKSVSHLKTDDVYKILDEDSLHIINVKNYGAIGDGLTDDTNAINTAISNSNENSILFFPKGRYLVNGFIENYKTGVREFTGKGLVLKSNLTVFMDDNAVIVQTPNKDYPSSLIFNCFNVQNVKFINCKIEGDLKTHNYNRIESGTSTDEWGMGIVVRYSKNIKIENCEIYNCMGDGVYIGTPDSTDTYDENYHNDNIIINNCYIHDCRRNGIAYTDGYNSIISNCKMDSINGTAPTSAIDVEGEGNIAYAIDNLNISNIVSSDCGIGISMYNFINVLLSNISIMNTLTVNSIRIVYNDGKAHFTNLKTDKNIYLTGKNISFDNITCNGMVQTQDFSGNISNSQLYDVEINGEGEIQIDDCLFNKPLVLKDGGCSIKIYDSIFNTNNKSCINSIVGYMSLSCYNCQFKNNQIANVPSIQINHSGQLNKICKFINCFFNTYVNIQYSIYELLFESCYFASLMNEGSFINANALTMIVKDCCFFPAGVQEGWETNLIATVSNQTIFMNNYVLSGGIKLTRGFYINPNNFVRSLVTNNYVKYMCTTDIVYVSGNNESGAVNY